MINEATYKKDDVQVDLIYGFVRRDQFDRAVYRGLSKATHSNLFQHKLAPPPPHLATEGPLATTYKAARYDDRSPAVGPNVLIQMMMSGDLGYTSTSRL